MTSKSVPFKPLPAPLRGAEKWVEGRIAQVETVTMKRLTLDIPAELHRQLKVHCAGSDLNMAELCRDLILKALASDAPRS